MADEKRPWIDVIRETMPKYLAGELSHGDDAFDAGYRLGVEETAKRLQATADALTCAWEEYLWDAVSEELAAIERELAGESKVS